jgi:NADH dehydrogenase
VILVVGATGSLGSRITYSLLDRGDQVRVLARRSSRYAGLQLGGAEVALGDLRDRQSIERACRGAAVVVTTASVSKTGDDSIENVDLEGNQTLIAAAEAAGVEHFLLVSTLGASADSPVPVFRAKAAAEERLRQSRMAGTILQPNAFMDVWFPMLIEAPALAGLPVTLVGESRRRHSFVAERDVAAFVIAAVRHPASRGATIAIGGPEALTLREAVAAYEEAAGRSLPLQSVAPGEPIPGVPEPVWGIAAALESFDSPIPMEESCRRYGITLTSVGDFARSRLGGTGAAPGTR